MKILTIGTTDKRGGAAMVSWNIKNELEKLGCSFSFFVADKLSSEPTVFEIKRNKLIKLLSFIFSTENLYRTNWILKAKGYKESDLVHCHNLHGRFFNLETMQKMSQEKPVVWTLHDEWAITPHCAYTFEGADIKNGFYQCPSKEIPPRLLWHNERFLMRQKKSVYDRSKLNIVVPCQWLKDRVEKSVLKNQNVKLIYNGIDTAKFVRHSKTQSRNELGLPLDRKIIFFLADAGKSNPWKGWEYTQQVVEHFSNNQEILFVCAGNDRPEQSDKNILYLPLIKEPELLAKYYSACDMLLYSSVADNFPLVILEAMSCGLPIVSFDVGGIKEALLHKQNGYIAKYRDRDDLLEGVRYLLELDQETLEKMSLDSSERIARNFNLKKMVSEYYQLYQDLAGKHE